MEENKMEQLNNKEFVDALRAMVMDESEENKKAMFDALIKSEFLAPITFLEDDETTAKDSGQRRFRFDAVQNGDGKVMFPVFTDTEELKKMKTEGEIPSIKVTMDTYAKIFAENKDIPVQGIVVNPHGMSLSVGRDFFDKNTGKGSRPVKFDKDTQFIFRQPRDPKTDMIEALCEYLKYRDNVRKVYFVDMFINDASDEDKAHMLLVIDARGNMQDITTGIGKIAEPYRGNRNLGMADYNTDFGKAATKNVEPFFKR